MRALTTCLSTVLLLAGCVSPLVNFTPYSNPTIPKENFEQAFTAWKGGSGNIDWSVHLKGSSFSQQELVIAANGPSSLGPAMAGGKTFTPTKTELRNVVQTMLDANLFGLYDGHYGAWLSNGGVGGPELRVLIGGMEKHVSKDSDLSGSWESGAIQKVSDMLVTLALKYVKN